jgi:hypothetical protein
MKKSTSILCFCVALAFTACKGNMHTESGDSTGTGSGGARTPGNETADTTRHDSTNTSPKSAIYKDSTKGNADTAKK